MDSSPHSPREIQHADARLENPTVRREARDLRIGRVIAVFGLCAFFIAVQTVVVWQYFGVSERHQQQTKASNYPLAQLPRWPCRASRGWRSWTARAASTKEMFSSAKRPNKIH